MIAALLMLLAVPAEAPAQNADRIAKVMAASEGKTQATAYKVRSVADEYEILRRLGLRPEQQSLVVDGAKAWDMLTAIDPATDGHVELWFDITSFYGKEF